MKVIDLLKIQREPLKVMSDCGLKVEDYGYIAMYEEYRERRSHNEKYRYVIMCLSMKYHISEFFGVNPKSEESAYLQGEIARQMFPAAAMVVCPKCNEE